MTQEFHDLEAQRMALAQRWRVLDYRRECRLNTEAQFKKVHCRSLERLRDTLKQKRDQAKKRNASLVELVADENDDPVPSGRESDSGRRLLEAKVARSDSTHTHSDKLAHSHTHSHAHRTRAPMSQREYQQKVAAKAERWREERLVRKRAQYEDMRAHEAEAKARLSATEQAEP